MLCVLDLLVCDVSGFKIFNNYGVGFYRFLLFYDVGLMLF